MFCTECGNKLDTDSKFCTKCGNKIDYALERKKNIISNEQIQSKAQIQQLQIQQAQLKLQAEQLKLQQEQFNSQVRCPKCGSTSISANKKGYGVVKGGLGAVILGGGTLGIGAPIGAALGNIGRNKVICTCMNCGYKFKPGKKK